MLEETELEEQVNPGGEELLGWRSVTRGGLWVFALHTEKKLGYSQSTERELDKGESNLGCWDRFQSIYSRC